MARLDENDAFAESAVAAEVCVMADGGRRRSTRRWNEVIVPNDHSLSWPDPASFSVDHFRFPLSGHEHLAESLENLAAAHLRRIQRETRAFSLALGTLPISSDHDTDFPL